MCVDEIKRAPYNKIMTNETNTTTKPGTENDGLVWVFSATTDVVKVHAVGCRGANLAVARREVTDPDDKADLLERGFRVTVCRCVRVGK